MKIWDKISIGATKSDILEFIGNEFHYQKGQMLFCELGDYSVNFTIKEDIVTKIVIEKIKVL